MGTAEQIREVLNEIVDPCSAAAHAPIGLVDMGIVADVRVSPDQVEVDLLPTFAGCLYIAMFIDQIERRLLALDCGQVTVNLLTDTWTEENIAAPHRKRLADMRTRTRLRAAH
jgi:metal-sulfur cluster biosynthetic enzyme